MVEGKEVQTDANGYLVDPNDWSETIAEALAAQEGVALTEKHWDVINYLRDEFLNHGGNQPNERTILKAMSDRWGVKLTSKDMYDLFPHMPSKQGAKISGLPESRRKGGY
jgi:tRNA 2-thiouridine synthesizing protein E